MDITTMDDELGIHTCHEGPLCAAWYLPEHGGTFTARDGCGHGSCVAMMGETCSGCILDGFDQMARARAARANMPSADPDLAADIAAELADDCAICPPGTCPGRSCAGNYGGI